MDRKIVWHTPAEEAEIKRQWLEEYNRVRAQRYTASSAAKRERERCAASLALGIKHVGIVVQNIQNANAPAIDWDYNDINENYAGEMKTVCKNCGAIHFNDERVVNWKDSFNDCCRHGEVTLANLSRPPDYIRGPFEPALIIQINFSIKFADTPTRSLSHHLKQILYSGKAPGPHDFKILGRLIYYQINTTPYPSDN